MDRLPSVKSRRVPLSMWSAVVVLASLLCLPAVLRAQDKTATTDKGAAATCCPTMCARAATPAELSALQREERDRAELAAARRETPDKTAAPVAAAQAASPKPADKAVTATAPRPDPKVADAAAKAAEKAAAMRKAELSVITIEESERDRLIAVRQSAVAEAQRSADAAAAVQAAAMRKQLEMQQKQARLQEAKKLAEFKFAQ